DAVGERRFSFDVPAGTRVLRVTLNSQLGDAQGGNNFDLFVKRDIPPAPANADCSDRGPFPLGFCEFTSPAAGTWHILVSNVSGSGPFQLTITQFRSSEVACV